MSVGAHVLRLRQNARAAALRAADAWRAPRRWFGRPLLVAGCFSPGFDGNAFDFALHATQDPRVDLIAVVRSEEERERLAGAGIRAVLFGSFQEHVALRLANAVFTVGHLSTDFSAMPNPEALRVMLWHATPMKAVGRLNRPAPDPIDHYDMVAATSDFSAKIMREAFASEGTKVAITGHPKTDRMRAAFDDRAVRERLRISPDARVISYLPTWRHDFTVEAGGDFGQNAGPLLRVMRELTAHASFRQTLERRQAVFLLKPHPMDDLAALRTLSEGCGDRIRILEPEDVDTVDLLRLTDVLVTDYSGALTDWLILAKPVVCFTFDYEEYWANRGSPSFDFRNTFGAIMAPSADVLASRLDEHLSRPDAQAEAIEDLSRLMHRHRDGGASRRVIDETLGMLQASGPAAAAHSEQVAA